MYHPGRVAILINMAFVHRPAVLITFIARSIMRIIFPASCSGPISHPRTLSADSARGGPVRLVAIRDNVAEGCDDAELWSLSVPLDTPTAQWERRADAILIHGVPGDADCRSCQYHGWCQDNNNGGTIEEV